MTPPIVRPLVRRAFLLGLVALLLVAVPVSGRHQRPPDPPSAATWQLVDDAQSVCFRTAGSTSSFGIWISGTWDRWIDVGISDLPSGGSYGTAYAPIPPGSSDGVSSLAYVRVTFNGHHEPGTATARLWASDGIATQAVPVTIVFRDRCSDY